MLKLLFNQKKIAHRTLIEMLTPHETLSKVALELLSIPPTSAAVDMIFSKKTFGISLLNYLKKPRESGNLVPFRVGGNLTPKNIIRYC